MSQTVGTVIVADDNKLSRELMKTIVEQQGFQVLEAANGKEVIDIINKQNVDLIFLDCYMPIMNGLEVAKKIKQSLASSIEKMPKIVGVSAYGNHLEDECKRAGMDTFFAKPINLTIIREYLKDYSFI
jgi:CheY-like chemotaxis protein